MNRYVEVQALAQVTMLNSGLVFNHVSTHTRLSNGWHNMWTVPNTPPYVQCIIVHYTMYSWTLYLPVFLRLSIFHHLQTTLHSSSPPSLWFGNILGGTTIITIVISFYVIIIIIISMFGNILAGTVGWRDNGVAASQSIRRGRQL